MSIRVHFDDTDLLTGARLVDQDAIRLVFGTAHTLALQLVAGQDETPVDLSAKSIARVLLVLAAAPGAPVRELYSAEYASSAVSGSTISMAVKVQTSAAFGYVEGRSSTRALLVLKCYRQNESAPVINFAVPCSLQGDPAARPVYDAVAAKQYADSALASKTAAAASAATAQAAADRIPDPSAGTSGQVPAVDSTGTAYALVDPVFSAAWDTITGKPSTFPPSVHVHAQSDVSGLSVTLAAKADLQDGKVPLSQLPAMDYVKEVVLQGSTATLVSGGTATIPLNTPSGVVAGRKLVTAAGTTPVISDMQSNTDYKFSQITSLRIDSVASVGMYESTVYFSSGSTPAQLTLPAGAGSSLVEAPAANCSYRLVAFDGMLVGCNYN